MILLSLPPKALKINQINSNEFITKAVETTEDIKKIKSFCYKNFDDSIPITLGSIMMIKQSSIINSVDMSSNASKFERWREKLEEKLQK